MVLSRDQFDELHKRCPECKSKKYTTTLIGYVEYSDKDYEDHNDITCVECGFEGTTMDLVE